MSDIGLGTWVKCVEDDWRAAPGCCGEGPSIGSVWQVNWIEQQPWRWSETRTFIGLDEWPSQEECFLADFFIPIGGDAEIERLRASITAPAKAKELVE